MTNDETVEYTREEWMAEGKKRFGKDTMKWKFTCPMCGNIQSAEDFRKYKDKGADPNDSFQRCLGRLTGGITNDKTAHKSKKKDGTPNCNWASFGLFSGPSYVKHEGEPPSGSHKSGTPVFNFAEPDKESDKKEVSELVEKE